MNHEEVDLSIIIVNWNGEKYIGECIKSLEDTIHSCLYEILVVDNASEDNSIGIIEQNFPNVKLIKNSQNLMFAEANNIGYRKSMGKIIALVNPDTVARPNVLDSLYEEACANKNRAFTTVLLNRDGSFQQRMHRGFPSFWRLLFSMLCVYKNLFCETRIVKNYLLTDRNFKLDQYIDQAAGALLFVHRESVELIDGLFDAELFPLFYNDVDLCYRLRQHGIPVVCKASDGVYHLKGASIDRLDIGNNLYQKLSGARNFFKKHKKTLDYFLTNVVFLMYSAIRKISGTVKNNNF